MSITATSISRANIQPSLITSRLVKEEFDSSFLVCSIDFLFKIEEASEIHDLVVANYLVTLSRADLAEVQPVAVAPFILAWLIIV